ncbi:hypothetical protein CPB84DRAFT_1764172 [Gymnopilus junonius]|uniref:Uncharacterized protein n=1 Tax=Gymnopilus junonius TaxID=109634 RepID=A0A9P5NZJ9_GYMJU|nr:hypothetical protein CPB84DRAFT_1764172 [Gymnopilus junonius]
MTMWPHEVRSDLRDGLRAKRKGDVDTAISYLSRAWQTTKSLPLETFGDDPLLKVTGIGIALGGLLEDAHRLEDAYAVYEDTFWLLRTAYMNLPPSTLDNRPDLGVETLKGLTRADRMRAVSLSYKLAEMAHDLSRPSEEEERWLVWSVEAILRTVLDAPPMKAVEVVTRDGTGTGVGDEHPKVKVLVEQLGLPTWSVRHDIAAPFEALGTYYAKSGNITYALPLYLQAISILLPPTPNVTPVEDRCRGAQLMGNVAELMISSTNTKNASPEALSQAEAWARKGLDVVIAARKLSPIKCDVCEESFAMLLYNVAMIRELSGDRTQARTLLTEALEQSKAIGMDEGIKYSEEALRALDEGKEEFKSFPIEPEGRQKKDETSESVLF